MMTCVLPCGMMDGGHGLVFQDDDFRCSPRLDAPLQQRRGAAADGRHQRRRLWLRRPTP